MDFLLLNGANCCTYNPKHFTSLMRKKKKLCLTRLFICSVSENCRALKGLASSSTERHEEGDMEAENLPFISLSFIKEQDDEMAFLCSIASSQKLL